MLVQTKNPQGRRKALRIAPATSSSPVPQPSRERWSREPTRGSAFCFGGRSRTICRVLGMKRPSTYCSEYASGRYHACGLASDPISFASQRKDPLAGSPSRAGLLAHGSPYSPCLPIPNVKRRSLFVKRRRRTRSYEIRFTRYVSRLGDSGNHGFRPHSQRRDREGLAPSSLTQESQSRGTIGERDKTCQVQ
jgi:hypothetical protein